MAEEFNEFMAYPEDLINPKSKSRLGLSLPSLEIINARSDLVITDSWPQWMAGLAVVLLFIAPGSLLSMLGIPYSSVGGSYIFKFHPASYLTLLAGMIAVLRESDRSRLVSVFRELPSAYFYLGTLLIVMIYTAYRFGSGGAGFYIDTLLIPGILVVLLSTATEHYKRLLFYSLIGLSVINSLLGMVEYTTEWRLISFMIEDEPAKEDYFRSTAFSNHPLENAQRTVSLLFAVFVLPVGLRILIASMLFISLLAFGSRTALIVGVLVLAAWLLLGFLRSLYQRLLDIRWLIILTIPVLAISALGIGMTIWLDLGSRIFENLVWDESAASRIDSLLLVKELSPDQLLLGIGFEGVAKLESTRGSWFNIENFWIVILLQLGVLMFLLFAAGLLGIFWGLAQRGPWAVRLSVMVYLLAASSNDALSHKTPNLAIVMAAWIGATAVGRKYAEQGMTEKQTHKYDFDITHLRDMSKAPIGGRITHA